MPSSWSQRKFPAKRSRGYVDIEREAQRARQLLGFDPEEPIPGMLFFERLGDLKTGTRGEIPVTYGVEELLEGVEAEARYNRPRRIMEVVLSPATYEMLEKEVPRAKFSVGHEAYHALHHHEELLSLSRIPRPQESLMRGAVQDIPVYSDTEWQADAGSGAIFVPAIAMWRLEAKRSLTIDELCRRFGVSYTCAKKRIRAYETRPEELVSA